MKFFSFLDDGTVPTAKQLTVTVIIGAILLYLVLFFGFAVSGPDVHVYEIDNNGRMERVK